MQVILDLDLDSNSLLKKWENNAYFMHKAIMVWRVIQVCTSSKYWTGEWKPKSFRLDFLPVYIQHPGPLPVWFYCLELSGRNFEVGIYSYSQKEFLNAQIFFSGHRPRPANSINCSFSLFVLTNILSDQILKLPET